MYLSCNVLRVLYLRFRYFTYFKLIIVIQVIMALEIQMLHWWLNSEGADEEEYRG